MKIKKSSLLIIAFLTVCTLELFSSHEWIDHKVATYDASGYYLYLPAVFIYHDLHELGFYPEINKKYRLSDQEWYGIYQQPATGGKLNKYPIGVAIAELPLFFVAHGICLITHQYPADGYSVPYQFCISFSTLLWCALGLWFTGKLLSALFSENAAVAALFFLAFGTNIYAYSCTSSGMSHLFVYTQFAMLLWYCFKWQQTFSPRYLYLQGILLGWTAITRPVDVLVFIIPLLWIAESIISNKEDAGTYLRKNITHILIALVCFMAVVFLQLAYWKYITGQWVHYSYEGEGFHFKNPHIADGLFSYYKGWFVYTPVALIALSGLFFLPRRLNMLRAAIIIYMGAIIYVVFSWYYWSYGWSFGCRALIESLAVVSIPLAALIYKIGTGKALVKTTSLIVGLFLVGLNIFQTHQYASNALPDGITRSYYWRVFLKMDVTDDDRKLLEPQPVKH